ncbi:four-carbon acid sugar kinase family protein [Planococcus chinensis]|uniref:Four-carbon acid sugar kinase family protein n=1 Tax=Planococcus chinensis TaxID=272917 RepID=A0ABW4QEY3_9BACL
MKKMATQIGIIADDFTGANDTGVRLAQKGLKSKVLLTDSIDYSRLPEQDIDVWIIDTNSRAMGPRAAYEAVFQEISRLSGCGIQSFYKKVDSTLRGSVASELKAMQDASGLDLIFLAPAFPAMGRTVEDGVLLVNGKPVAETEFAKDPKTPVLHSYIPDLLADGGSKTAVLTKEILRGLKPEQWVDEQLRDGVQWIVCDTVEEGDFRKLSELAKRLDVAVGWAGSAGMINHLYTEYERENTENTLEGPLEKVLVLSGSLSGKTGEQLEALKLRPNTLMIEVDPLDLLEGEAEVFEGVSRKVRTDEFDCAVIYVYGSQENRRKTASWAEMNGRTANQIGQAISAGIGKLARQALETTAFDALIMTGGDTAKDICSELGIHDMELRFEVEAGLPLGMVAWNNKEMPAITKAGGFGNAESLSNAVDYLRGAGIHASN